MQYGHRILHGTGCERTRNKQHLIEMDVEASKAWCAMCATEFDWETILEEMLGRIAPLEDEVRRLREENFTLIKESSCDKNVVIPDLERQIETVHESITRMIQEVGYRTPG